MSVKISNATPAFYVDESYPGYILVVLQHDQAESYMIKQDGKTWAMNMIGLYMFPNSFGYAITGAPRNTAIWANSVGKVPAFDTTHATVTHKKRISSADYMMLHVPRDLGFKLVDTDTSKCYVSKMSAERTTIQDDESGYTMQRSCNATIIHNSATDETFTIVVAGRAFGPTNMKFIIGGKSCAAYIDGRQVIVALTDDTLIVTDSLSHEFKTCKLGAAIVMLYRILFVRAARAYRDD